MLFQKSIKVGLLASVSDISEYPKKHVFNIKNESTFHASSNMNANHIFVCSDGGNNDFVCSDGGNNDAKMLFYYKNWFRLLMNNSNCCTTNPAATQGLYRRGRIRFPGRCLGSTLSTGVVRFFINRNIEQNSTYSRGCFTSRCSHWRIYKNFDNLKNNWKNLD